MSDCETRLHAATVTWDRTLDFPSVDLFRTWRWKNGAHHLELRYSHARTMEDYRIRVEVVEGAEGFAWRVIAQPGAWRTERTEGRRSATFRSVGPRDRRGREAFLSTFRPVLDTCLEH